MEEREQEENGEKKGLFSWQRGGVGAKSCFTFTVNCSSLAETDKHKTNVPPT